MISGFCRFSIGAMEGVHRIGEAEKKWKLRHM